MGTNSETIDGLVLVNGSITGTGTLTGTSAMDVQSGSIAANLAGSVGLGKSTGGHRHADRGEHLLRHHYDFGRHPRCGRHPKWRRRTFSIASLATLRGSGVINANISGAPGSSIVSDGNLTLGNSASTSGFSTAGTLTVGLGHVVTINDQNAALLGISTVVNGTLQRPGGVGIFSLADGEVLSGSGTVAGTIDTNMGSISPGTAGTAVLSQTEI